MINIDPTVLIIMGEVILALLVAMGGTIIFLLKGKRRDRAAAAELEARLKKNAPKRQEWYENVLTDSIENGDADANRELASTWVEKENQFYAQMVEMYMKRNTTALRGLDKLLHEYTSSYLELVSLMRSRIDEEQESVPVDVKEKLERMILEGERLSKVVKSLEEDNVRLSSELEKANSEIDQAMREYSVAFRPGSGMTGSAGVVAPVAVAAAAAAAVATVVADEKGDESSAADEVAVSEPLLTDEEHDAVAELESSDSMDGDLDELGSEILAETSDLDGGRLDDELVIDGSDTVFAEEVTEHGAAVAEVLGDVLELEPDQGTDLDGDAVDEIDLAAFDMLPDAATEGEDLAAPLVDDAAVLPVDDEIAAVAGLPPEETSGGTFKGLQIDLAEEGDIILPELNGLVSSIEDELDENIPVLDESPEPLAQAGDDDFLAQLDELDAEELEPFSSKMVMDEMEDLIVPSGKGEEIGRKG